MILYTFRTCLEEKELQIFKLKIMMEKFKDEGFKLCFLHSTDNFIK